MTSAKARLTEELGETMSRYTRIKRYIQFTLLLCTIIAAEILIFSNPSDDSPVRSSAYQLDAEPVH